MREFIYRVTKRVLTWFGDLMLATKPPETKAKQILEMLDVIQPGDVICRKYSYYLDSYFIPGVYTHSGIVIDKEIMVHSIAEGVCYVHPIDFVKDCDGFIVLRPNGDVPKMIEKAIWHVENDTEYDFTFKDPNRFYCHEFTCDCLDDGGVIVETKEIEFGIWPIKFTKILYIADCIIEKLATIYEFRGL